MPRDPRPQYDPNLDLFVRGAPEALFRDLYHRFLRMTWSAALGCIVCAIMSANLVFAVGYVLTGGVQNMREGSFRDAFFFSVQTLATIGYGGMTPTGDGANLLVTVESTLGLLMAALATGLVFSKFTVSSARIRFTRHLTLGPMNGVPTLRFRLHNERGNRVIEANVRVVLSRTERTTEGELFFRQLDLPLIRERTPAMSRSFTAMHAVTAASPLHGLTPDDYRRLELEFFVTIVGMDETSAQPMHASHTYMFDDVLWGTRPADMIGETAAGKLMVDLTRFHDVVETEPTADFPYRGGRMTPD
jgi:inward rectifier potassium channel